MRHSGRPDAPTLRFAVLNGFSDMLRAGPRPEFPVREAILRALSLCASCSARRSWPTAYVRSLPKRERRFGGQVAPWGSALRLADPLIAGQWDPRQPRAQGADQRPPGATAWRPSWRRRSPAPQPRELVYPVSDLRVLAAKFDACPDLSPFGVYLKRNCGL